MNETIETKSTAPKPTALIVAAIKPPQLFPIADEKAEGGHKYFTTYVQQDGVQVTTRCTKEVFNWIDSERPWFDCHTEWILSIARSATDKDEQGKPVTIVVDVLRKPTFRKEMSPGALDMDNLVLQKSGNTYEPLNLPLRFDPETLDEVVRLLEDAGVVKSGNTLGGRFVVRQVLNDGDNCYVGIDLKSER